MSETGHFLRFLNTDTRQNPPSLVARQPWFRLYMPGSGIRLICFSSSLSRWTDKFILSQICKFSKSTGFAVVNKSLYFQV